MNSGEDYPLQRSVRNIHLIGARSKPPLITDVGRVMNHISLSQGKTENMIARDLALAVQDEQLHKD